jgi:hypothetical protein
VRHPVAVSHAADEASQHDLDEHEAHADAALGDAELAADEPRTPVWLTATGGGLFLALAIVWLADRPAERTLSELTPAAASASAVEAAPSPPPAPQPVNPAPPPPTIAVSAAPPAVAAPHAGKVPGQKAPKGKKPPPSPPP